MSKRLIFMGTPDYARQILEELLKHFEILAIFTQPDKAVGRKQILTPSEVKKFAMQKMPEIPIFTPNLLKDEKLFEILKEFKPDFIIVAAYGKILPSQILKIAPCINLHASLLPKFRGASPIQSAILAGEKISGVCSMLMNEGLDTGEILLNQECEITNKSAPELFEIFAQMAAKLAVQTIKNFSQITPKKQDEKLATLCKKIKKEDGKIELSSAREIYKKFLAFKIWPGIFLENGLKFLDIELIDENSKHEKAGEILGVFDDGFLLACKNGILKIKNLQESGKKALIGRVYLNGKRLKIADYLC